MISCLEHTIENAMDKTIRNHEGNGIIQFKIPAIPYSAQTVFNVLEHLEKEYSDSEFDINIKIALGAIERWHISDPEVANAIERNYPSWISEYNNLTAYRNSAASNRMHNTVLLLVGTDLIDDKASLEHIRNFSPDELLKAEMENSTLCWVKYVFEENEEYFGIADENTVQNCAQLFDAVLSSSDLNELDKYLSGLNYSDEMFRLHPVEAFGLHLDTLGIIPLIRKSHKVADAKRVIKKAREFMGGSLVLSLKPAAVKSKLKAIEQLEVNPESLELDSKNGEDTFQHRFDGFSCVDDYLAACKSILNQEASIEQIEQLSKCDGYTLVDRVLGFKPPKERRRKTDSEVTLIGMPLESVLKALWDTIGDEAFGCNNVTAVNIKPKCLSHDRIVNRNHASIDSEDFLFDEFIKPYWNGIDQIIDGINDRIQFENIEALDGVCISSSFTSDKNLYQYEAKVNRLPALHFVIEVLDEDKTVFENQYKWVYQPDNQMHDSAVLVKYTFNYLLNENNFIPIFFLKKFPELSQRIETGRISSIASFFQDIEVEKCIYHDVPIQIWQRLSLEYRAYLEKYEHEGFYPAMLDQQRDQLADSYKAFLDYFLTNNDTFKKNNSETNRAIKSFMVLDSSDRKSDDIFNMPLISATALTVLHPALVEMVASQISYLRQQFVQNIKLLLASGDKLDKDAMFEKLSDFAKLQSPLPGILSEGRQVFTNTFGDGLLYILKGNSSADETGIPITPDCMSNDDLDEDDISDAELTRVSEESALIERLIKEYSECYAYALDNLRIAVLLPQNVQPALAAVFKLMNGNKSRSQSSIKSLSLLFCIDTDRENQLINWVARAKTYWQEQQLKDGATAISQFETGYRVVSSDDMIGELFGNGSSSRLDVDIILLYEKGKETSECHWINPMSANDIRLRFPLIRKFMPKSIYNNATYTDFRSQLISNYQFICYSTYQKYLNALASSNVPWTDSKEQKSAVLFEKYDFSEWTEVLKRSFDSAERVIVIGSNIDKDLIEKCGNNTIIGFGSGCGSSADLNYAVATAQRRIVDVSKQISNKVSALFGFDKDTNEKVMKSVLDACDKMADLSLIRTLNFNEFYINNFLGYSMIRHLLVPEHVDRCFCDVVVSLDSYKHWFVSDKENTKRADLLWVVAYVKKNAEGHSMFDIKLTIIESKLAGDVADRHLRKAVTQVYDTLVGFEKNFKPSTGSNDVSYDSRYWWMQLHRIITANSSLQGRADYDDEKIEALEYLAEGVYEVSFDHAVMAFETESNMVTSSLGVDVFDGKYEERNFTSKAFVFNKFGIAKFIGEPAGTDWKTLTSYFENESMPQTVEVSAETVSQEVKKAKEAENKEKKEQEICNKETIFRLEERLSFDPIGAVADRKELHMPDQGKCEEKKTEGHVSQSVYRDNRSNRAETVTEPVAETKLSSDIPDIGSMRILLGRTNNGEAVYWNYGTDYSLINRHMLILGSSGSGKSYAIQAILAELARYQQQSLILDYTDGFVKTQINPSVAPFVFESRVRDEKIPINPFVKHIASYGADDLSDPTYEHPFEVGERVANTFKNEFRTIGENQISILRHFIEEGVEREGDKFTVSQLFNDIRSYNPKNSDIQYSKMQVSGLAAKIETFCKYDPFYSVGKESPWSKIFYDKETKTPISIFQLSTLPSSTQLVIIEFVLWDLWNDLISRRSTVKTPHPVVLDEIQNLSIVGGSPVWKYLKEGRKLGLGLISATQSFKGLGGVNSEGADSLFGSATKLFFRPQPNEMKTFASLLEKEDNTYSVDSWERQLSNLGRGECIVTSITGDQRVRAKKIKITSLQDRGF